VRCVPPFVALALVLCSSLAVAAAPVRRKGARLSWVRGIEAERCVGLVGLEEDVKSRLGYDPLALPSEVAIEGVVVRAAKGFRAEIVVRDADGKVLGTRQLASTDADCRALGEAVAVAITVAIDPEAVAARPDLVPEPAVTPAPAEPACPACPPVAREREGRATATLGASAGLVPGLSLVTSIHAHAALGARWEVGIGASFWPESQTAGLGFALVSAAFEGCVVPMASAAFLRWCAAVHAGVFEVFVHARELAPVDVGEFAWAAGESGPSLSVRVVGPLHAEASASALVPFVRRQGFLRGRTDPTWEQNLIGGRAELGLGASF
jgi:hypothetical protein